MRDIDNYSIRPAGRHILTIGRDLIQDKYAAIVELVKNAYDADSPDVILEFKKTTQKYEIIISDHGHGMTRETVINKWMVPSTDDKLKRKLSPGRKIEGNIVKRIMQGRKGVGRYAASILGDSLTLETTVKNGEKTTALIEWGDFEKVEYLDEVEILIETEKSESKPGTILTVALNVDQVDEWNQKDIKGPTQLNHLRKELKKLISPVNSALSDNQSNDSFVIYLKYENFFKGYEDLTTEKIEPFPIFDLFDYRISGKVSSEGYGVLNYSMQRARNTIEEAIEFDLKTQTDCGELYYDVRVYDRETDAITSLIKRGLKDETGNYLGNLEARRLLNSSNGLSVYRNGFRIRPLGDPDFDWVELNKERIQSPSRKIGSNQVIGFVQIQSEEESDLVEKSARDGLRENLAYEKLKAITKKIISELETRRFTFRMKAGLSRPLLKVERELEKLFSFDELKSDLMVKLKKGGITTKAADDIINILTKEENTKNKIAEGIRKTVAVYQGQATLGKIINVILHEGRRPLNFFKNQIPNIHYWANSFQKSKNLATLEKLLPITNMIETNVDVFVNLFSRLDPLASGRRSARKSVKLKKTITDVFAIFEKQMSSYGVSFEFSSADEVEFMCWHQDLYAIFANLIDNSIYWMIEKKTSIKNITIAIIVKDKELQYIDYRDTGPGIEPELILNEVIFEPQFSTKPDGAGLGLAIAGEAATRNNLELKAFESETGAYFRIQYTTEK